MTGQPIGLEPPLFVDVGLVCCSAEPTRLSTVLCSCATVCLRAPHLAVGGMNHFALPSATRGQKGPRHGCDGIDLLVQGMADLGRRRPNLRAKLSGGSAVLPMAGSGGICASNIAVAIDHLAIHGIPIIGRRTGGNQGMLVHFFTGSGDALFRPIIRQLFEEGSQP